MPKLCTETFNYNNPASIETYFKCGGYEAWKNILKDQTSKSEIIIGLPFLFSISIIDDAVSPS